MSVKDQIRLIVYRMHSKGLEFLLLNQGDVHEYWKLPDGSVNLELFRETMLQQCIEIDGKNEAGEKIKAYAIEADWHDIPRIRAILKHDVHLLKEKVLVKVPEIEQGAYVALKSTVKKMLPHEYAMLKEVKDILFDRNTVINI